MSRRLPFTYVAPRYVAPRAPALPLHVALAAIFGAALATSGFIALCVVALGIVGY